MPFPRFKNCLVYKSCSNENTYMKNEKFKKSHDSFLTGCFASKIIINEVKMFGKGYVQFSAVSLEENGILLCKGLETIHLFAWKFLLADCHPLDDQIIRRSIATNSHF